MGTTTIRLVVEHDDRWIAIAIQIIAAISPQIRTLSLATARIQLRHRCFVSVQNASLTQYLAQTLSQRL